MSARSPKRSLDPNREIDKRFGYDDHRDAFTRFMDAIAQRKPALVVLSLMTLFIALWPSMFYVFFIPGVMIMASASDVMAAQAKQHPMRLPFDAKRLDFKDPKPRRKKFYMARGLLYLGNRMSDGAEVWQSASDAVRHWLMFGTTGAGKPQPVDEPVLTPEGWVPIGHLEPGDLVIGSAGLPVRVSEIHPKGRMPVMMLTTGDGRSVSATPDHLWTLATGEVVDTSEIARRCHRPGHNTALVLGAPVDGDQPMTESMDEIVRSWTRGDSAPPDDCAIARWPRQQRIDLMQALLGVASTRGTCSFGDWARVPVCSLYSADSLMTFAWSCGFQAKLVGDGALEVDLVYPSFAGFLARRFSPQGVLVSSVQTVIDAECVCIELASDDSLYLTRNFLLTHNTNTLLSVAVANALALSSGLFYSDAKASPDLIFKVASMARRMGRDDDVLVINYITGLSDQGVQGRVRKSNTSNPFEDGPADASVQVMAGLMPKSEGDNAVFGERAMALLNAILYPLTDLRDAGYINLGVNEIRNALNLQTLFVYATDDSLPISEKSRAILEAYFESLPGFDVRKLKAAAAAGDLTKFTLPQEAGRQFGFAQMYFTRAISSLIDSYGHIYCVNMGELDNTDAVVNRRIVVIMLPPLEKSIQEIGNLGKINLTALRGGMKVGLGWGIEGDKEHVLDAVATKSTTPVIICCDEIAYQVAEGIAVTAAQARGLNIMMIFAGQDYAGLRKASETEAQQIVENTITKFFMKMEGAGETLDLIAKTVGQGMVAKADGGRRPDGSSVPGRISKGEFRYDKEDRITITDMRDLIEGEAYITFGNDLILASMAHADLKEMRNFRINRYLRIARPSGDGVTEQQSHFNAIDEFLMSRQRHDSEPVVELTRDLRPPIEMMRDLKAAGINANMRALTVATLYGASSDAERETGRGGATASPATAPAAAAADIDADDLMSAIEHRSSSRPPPRAAVTADDLTGDIEDLLASVDDMTSYATASMADAKPNPTRNEGLLDSLNEAPGDEDEDFAELDQLVEAATTEARGPKSPPGAVEPGFTDLSGDLESYLTGYINSAVGNRALPRASKELADEAAELIRNAARYPQPPTPRSDSAGLTENERGLLNSLLELGDPNSAGA